MSHLEPDCDDIPARRDYARLWRGAEGAARLGKKAVGPEQCRASFEAPLREAPQDEAFFLMPSKTSLMLRSDAAQPGRVSKHARRPMQRILAQPLRFSAPTRAPSRSRTSTRAGWSSTRYADASSGSS